MPTTITKFCPTIFESFCKDALGCEKTSSGTLPVNPVLNVAISLSSQPLTFYYQNFHVETNYRAIQNFVGRRDIGPLFQFVNQWRAKRRRSMATT